MTLERKRMDCSVIIPSRNEKYLARTVEDILKNMRAETEVIAVCNGCWPNPRIPEHPRVILVHTTEPIGQRPAINLGVKLSRAKYILKCDGHTAFDKGFDVKLMADCEYDWTVLPRMYNLDHETWLPKKHKVTDYMWIRSIDSLAKPFRHCYYDVKAHRECPEERKVHKVWAKTQGDISDVMTGQGACFFMHRQRYWDLDGMDEKHGQWGQMGVEIACKAWLSGGRQVVNKKTWFAHFFRGRGGQKRVPWPMSGRRQQKARDYSQDLWLNNKWHLQTRPLSWLVEKFLPLPDWDKYLKDHEGDNLIFTKGKNKMVRPPKRKPGEVPQYSQEYCRQQLTDEELKIEYKSAHIKTVRRNTSRSFVQGEELNVKELFENRMGYCRPSKRYGIMWQMKIIPPFLKSILANDKFTDEQLKEFKYYKYLISRLNPLNNGENGPDKRGIKHCIGKMRDYIKLAYDIRDNGLKAPIDMYCSDKPVHLDGEWLDKVIITRGSRRLAILHSLGVEKVPTRVWKSEWLAHHYIPDAHWPTDNGSIHACAVRQFVKMGVNATDKYWRHGYTPWYDNHIGKFQKGGHTKKILELGIKTGTSLLLWRSAFRAGEIYGLDIDPSESKELLKGKSRIIVIKGNQKDKKLLGKIGNKYGKFHVVIDDASHKPHNQRKSFEALWNHLESGGVYVFEDTQSNYRPKYKPKTIFPMLKSMVDDIYETHKVKEVHFYPNIVFITKA